MREYMIVPSFDFAAMSEAAAQAKSYDEKVRSVGAIKKQAYDGMHAPVSEIVNRTGGQIFNETPDSHMGVIVSDEAAEEIRNLKDANGRSLVEQIMENVAGGFTPAEAPKPDAGQAAAGIAREYEVTADFNKACMAGHSFSWIRQGWETVAALGRMRVLHIEPLLAQEGGRVIGPVAPKLFAEGDDPKKYETLVIEAKPETAAKIGAATGGIAQARLRTI